MRVFRVAVQKKFYAIALIVALLTLKASLSTPALQKSPSDLYSSGASLIIGTIIETSDGTPLRLGRVRSELPNHANAVLFHVAPRIGTGPTGTIPALLVAFSIWLLAVGREQAIAPRDMVSRK